MNDRFFKNTKSLCPVCLEEVKAQLFQNNGKITINKECGLHGPFHDIVDPKADLYLQCRAKRKRRYKPYGIVIPVSSDCNLQCKWCYLPDTNQHKEFSSHTIKNIIDTCDHSYIVFSGGEPTLRKDLPELIAYVNNNHPQKYPVLLTNGIKLADRAYLKLLKKAGLHYVIFSLNSFRKEAHYYFYNADLRALKAQALNNLKKENLWTILSMTLAKDVNEEDVKKIYHYGLKNIDFIRQLRLRNVTEIGTFVKGKHLYLSDMVALVSNAIGFSIDEMSQHNRSINKVFMSSNYFALDMLKMMSKKFKNTPIGRLCYWKDIIKHSGGINTCKILFESYRPPQTRHMFRIEIFYWPSPGNIDLSETRLFCIDHVNNNGEILPFWEALYSNERMGIPK
ncbi:MAG: radical SAM protein [bacterium]